MIQRGHDPKSRALTDLIDLMMGHTESAEGYGEIELEQKLESLLTDAEAAKILNVSVKQVRRYRTDPDPRKRLPSIEIGRLRRIEPSDLENFIRVRRRP